MHAIAKVLVMWWCVAALSAADTFVTRSGAGFQYAGNVFHPAGTNCYYLTYKSDAMIASVLDDAKAMGLNVVRVWGFMDCGNGDPGATPAVLPAGNKDGIYFQYWNSSTNALTINDGPDGLQRLDKVIAMADARGLKVSVVLVNNWNDFGGMDQYLSWFSQTFHDQFYSNSSIIAAYQAYIGHLINRTNTVNGRQYKNDTAIFSWELANEPRCIGSTAGLNRTTVWTTATITTWAGTMANVIKWLDPNHLVAVGDEGFFNRVSADWAYAGEGGVDHEALLALTSIDYGTFHCYPDN